MAPITNRVMEELVNALRVPADAFRFRNVGPGTPASRVLRMLDDNVLCHLALHEKGSARFLGLAQCIAPNFQHGTAQLAVYLDSDVRAAAWPLEGVLLFMRYAFHAYPLRKLYIEVPAGNSGYLSAGLHRIAQLESVLKAHEWQAGRYADVEVFSIDREKVGALMSVLLRGSRGQ